MNWKEIKDIIGDNAEGVIAGGLNLQEINGRYSCPATEHVQDNNSCQWYPDFHFFCHDCHKSYDIINYAKAQPEPYKFLCETAGVEYRKKRKFKEIKAITKDTSDAGIKYLESRGIRKETIDLYRVRSDADWIYFNYATPDNELVATKWREIRNKKFNASDNGTSILYGMHLLKEQTVLIICEGEIDCLTMHQIIADMGKQDKILCSSVPCGAKSLNENLVELCKPWLDRFERITIVPDNDENGIGMELVEGARELMGEYDIDYVELPVKDVNEYYQNADLNPVDIFNNPIKIEPNLEHSVYAGTLPEEKEKNGRSSGFVALDYNMNGLKDGWVTLATGLRGEGKTTFTRQILLAYAMQGLKSFMFCGESSVAKERDLLARLGCNKDEIVRERGTGGRDIYKITDNIREEFNKKYGDFILLSDMDKVRNKETYDAIFGEMKKMVRVGVKLFIIDNLMKITVDSGGGKVFDKQREVITDLKVFAMRHGIHVILIAHPNKAGEKISGAQEIENTADAILRYERIKDPSQDTTIQSLDLPQDVKDNISAVIKTLKVRDEGTYYPAWITWDVQRGAVINVSTLPEAMNYESKGWWTKSVHRYEQADKPQTPGYIQN